MSPHLAARLNGSPIDLESLIGIAEGQSGPWIVEGAGGVLVPLSEQTLLIDLIQRLQRPAPSVLPVLIVARSGLGTINHTLLTIEALGRRAIPVAGIVMVGRRDDLSTENRRAIERHGHVPVVAELPTLDPLTPEALQQWADESLDRDGRLVPWLRSD